MATFEKYNSFTTIDFETASSAYFSACSIGIACVVDKEIVSKDYYLIQPPDNHYDNANIEIHGISPSDTAQADPFPVVWANIKHLFINTYVAAHNANFDMSVLKATLNYYGIEYPDFLYFDTIRISGLFLTAEDGIGKGLEARCKHFNVPLPEHHNALCDATAAAGLVLYALNNSRYKNIGTFLTIRGRMNDFADVKLKQFVKFGGYKAISIKEIVQSVDTSTSIKDDDFNGKVFVFTGELKRLTREQAYAKVIAGGGEVKNKVTKKVDFLVNADVAITGKIKDALNLQQNGHHIKILTDEQFMEMLESEQAIIL